MSNDNNPYEPPKSDVTPEAAVPPTLALLPHPRSLPLKSGISWLSESWPIVKSNIGAWILVTIALFALQITFSFIIKDAFVIGLEIPFILGITMVSTIVNGGIMIGARDASHGLPFRFEYLFAGAKQKLAPLAMLGALSFCISQASEYLISNVIGINLDALQAGTESPAAIFNAIMPEQIAVSVILYLLTAMLFWFSELLVVLNDVPALRSLGMSLHACLRNPLPLLIYTVALIGLIVLGAIPLLLGLLVVVPWIFSSMYISYKQIFLQ